MKVKTLRFWISNSRALREEIGSNYSVYGDLKNTSFEEIDEQLNEALLDIDTKEHRVIKDIKINDIVINRHNNGGSDSILRTYTIIY